MQLHVRGRARALDCVCSIISSRLHARVKTHVYKVLRCKSCEAWHEFCHTIVPVIAVCANNKFQNCIFNLFQARCQFNWKALSRFKRMKLYISDVPYPLVRFPLVASTRHKLRRFLTLRCPSLQKVLWPLKVPSVAYTPLTAGRSRRTVKSIAARLSERERLFRLFSSRGAASFSSLAFFGIAGRAEKWRRKGRSFASAYRTLAAAGAAVDVLRMRKTRKSGAVRGRRGQWNWNGESGSQNRLA